MKPTVYTQDLYDYVVSELKAGSLPSKIYPEALVRGYNGTKKAFGKYVARLRKTHDIAYTGSSIQTYINQIPQSTQIKASKDDILISLLKRNSHIKFVDLCDMYDCPPARMKEIIDEYRCKGHEIINDGYKVYLSNSVVSKIDDVPQVADKEIIFAVASDLHFGSKACQISALHEFCSVARDKGVRHIFVPGDVLAGNNVYTGQLYDQYAISAEEQIQSALANLPTGFEWFMLGGNHDHSFISKGGGNNVVAALANERDDIHYIGFDVADVPILNNVMLRMYHPSGGVPYSLSYRLQKTAEHIAFSELTEIAYGSKDRPTIRFILAGHLHIQCQAMFGSIFGAQCGCFEGTTNYLARKGLTPNVGGYIVDACLGKNGLLKNFGAKFYTYEEIADDWENYTHVYTNKKSELDDDIEPLFE